MSSVEAAHPAARHGPAPRSGASRDGSAREVPARHDDLGRGRGRLLRSELRLVLTRLRNVALAAGTARSGLAARPSLQLWIMRVTALVLVAGAVATTVEGWRA